MPSVVKATAIVNGDVITQTDVDQRLAFLAIANGGQIPPEEVDRLREQVLRNLIDETLEIQAAKAEKIEIKQSDIDKTDRPRRRRMPRRPRRSSQPISQANGSNIKSMRRQIQGEIAWQRLQRAKIESGVSVGDDEVKAVLDKLNASKGTEEYRVGEIFLSATPATESQTLDNANKILVAAAQRRLVRRLCPAIFGSVDRGGRRRPRLGPPGTAARAARDSVLRDMPAGAISNPIPVRAAIRSSPCSDTRKILTRRSARRGPQPEAGFDQLPEGHHTRTRPNRSSRRFAEAAQNIGGCGGAEKIAADFHGEVVTSDQVKMRDLPTALQRLMLPMQVGQATQPFGSLEEGVRVLVICGRDEVELDGAELRRRLQPAQRGAGQLARPPLSARPSPRRGDRIPLILHIR